MYQIRKRLTYANVMSSIAVFLVLGGATAFAASSLGKNTVGSKQLKKEAVSAAKIKNGAITGSKLNLSALGTVPAATTAESATTAKTADSAKTATAATTANSANTANTAATANTASIAGKAGQISRLTTVKVDFTVPSGAGGNNKGVAECPAGAQAIGGGVRADPAGVQGIIVSSRPSVGPEGLPQTGEAFNSWRGAVTNTAAGALESTVWVICAG